MSFGAPEILVILSIVLVLFGAKHVPKLMRSVGDGVRGFKESMREDSHTTQTDPPAPLQNPAPPGEQK